MVVVLVVVVTGEGGLRRFVPHKILQRLGLLTLGQIRLDNIAPRLLARAHPKFSLSYI